MSGPAEQQQTKMSEEEYKRRMSEIRNKIDAATNIFFGKTNATATGRQLEELLDHIQHLHFDMDKVTEQHTGCTWSNTLIHRYVEMVNMCERRYLSEKKARAAAGKTLSLADLFLGYTNKTISKLCLDVERDHHTKTAITLAADAISRESETTKNNDNAHEQLAEDLRRYENTKAPDLETVNQQLRARLATECKEDNDIINGTKDSETIKEAKQRIRKREIIANTDWRRTLRVVDILTRANKNTPSY